MKPQLFLLILIYFLSVRNAYEQQTILNSSSDALHTLLKPAYFICGNDETLYRLRKNPVFRTRENKMNDEIANYTVNSEEGIITLPVVVHIINDNPASITDSQIIAGIQLLNDAFSKTGVYASSKGADTKIRFCIAKRDPDDGITTGITRTTSYFSDHLNKINEDSLMKNLIQWDPLKYINIWLVGSIEGETSASFSCGNWTRLREGAYATMPPGGDVTDGIVIPYFGVILAHEMGHYLGLYHTFQGGCTNNNCLLDGDMVCDTPPDNSTNPSPGCSSPENSCSTDTLSNYSDGFFHTDVPDQIANFMDYGNTNCSNEFTQGQANRMRATIMTQRTGLLQDECTVPCPDSISANFTRDIAYSITGNTIHFTNTSTGATGFQWLVNDVVISTALNFSYTFNRAGKDKITLKAFKTPGCFAAYTDYIISSCGVQARFYTNKDAIASKAGVYTDSIVFTNDSYNGITYKWLVSNDKGMAQHVVSTASSLTYVFPTPANYIIKLAATNGACSDTTGSYPVFVQDPTANGQPFSVTASCFAPDQVQINFCIEDYGFAPLPVNTPVSFYDADPRLSVAHKLSPSFYLNTAVPGGNCYSCYTQVLDAPYHGLESVYLVFNDSGKALPLALPNTKLIESNYADNIASSQTVNTNIYVSICQGQVYEGHTTSGLFTDTLKSINNGCDSIRTLHLTISSGIKSSVTTSICNGQIYAGHTTAGMFTDTFRTASGCDSTRTLFLSINPPSFSTINAVICEGQSYFAGENAHTVTGIYTDTVNSYTGCDSVITTNLTVNSLPQPKLGDDTGICAGTYLVLNPGNFAGYLWQDGTTGNTYTTNTAGQYYVSVTNNFGCKASDTITLLAVHALPAGFLPADTSICKESTLQINLPGYSNYVWSTGSRSSFIDITQTGLYSVMVIDKYGCSGSDSITITNHHCLSVFVPTAFTPNSDGLNDIFKPLFPSPVSNYHLSIFNRWGNKVFESTNVSLGWDGKYKSIDQPIGGYIYLFTFKDIDGAYETKYGSFTLIR